VKWRPKTSWAAWWQAIALPVLRDTVALGLGAYGFLSQVHAPDPSSVIVTGSLILIGGVGVIHAYTLLSGPSSTPPTGQPSSEHAPPSPSSPSSPSSPQGGPDERG
jgi:hypothetical protein